MSEIIIQEIQIKRGSSENISNHELKEGEPCFALDTKQLYVGNNEIRITANNLIGLLNSANIPFGISEEEVARGNHNHTNILWADMSW